MLLARAMEEKLGSLYRAGGRIVGGVYLGRGQEAFSAALGSQLQMGHDVYGPLIRDQAGRLAFGEPVLDCFRTYLGTMTGPMRGRDGNVHRGRPKDGLLAMISHLGSLPSVVAGALLARRLQGRLGDSIGGTTIGEGGTSTGAFHEALNLIAVERLPVIVAVSNNQYAYSTPNDRQFACRDLVDRAVGYGVEGCAVDGTDLAACLVAFRRAAARARAGKGPTLIVGQLLRLGGHGEHDDASYIPESLKRSPLGRDCLALAETFLKEREWATNEEIEGWRGENRAVVEQALAQASREPVPDPFKESWKAISTTELVEGNEA